MDKDHTEKRNVNLFLVVICTYIYNICNHFPVILVCCNQSIHLKVRCTHFRFKKNYGDTLTVSLLPNKTRNKTNYLDCKTKVTLFVD